MDSLIYILFVCISLPLFIATFLMNKKARAIILFVIIGTFMCTFVSEVNGMIKLLSDCSMFYLTTNLTPITEEVVKAIPVILFAFAISDDRNTIITLGIAEGIGFAILENAYIFINAGSSSGILWAFTRVFGASLMHGICTAMVGLGVSYVHKRKKLFYTGTFALLSAAMIYHSIYNALVQSSAPYIGYLLPIVTYIPIVIAIVRSDKKKKIQEAEN